MRRYNRFNPEVMMRIVRQISVICVLVVFSLPFAPACSADAVQVPGANPVSVLDQNNSPFDTQHDRKDPFMIEQERKMARERQRERYQQLKRDSERLLELSTELKQYVDKANSDILSIQVIKKAEQIEKLAKQVKDRMRSE